MRTNRYRHRLTTLAAVLVLAGCLLVPPAAARKVSPLRPWTGPRMLIGAFPGGATGEEDDITPVGADSFARTAGSSLDWIYFSDNWYTSRAFPTAAATWIRARGATPFVRLMLRSDAELDHAEPVFTLQRITDGDFDADLRAWARDAKAFGTPVKVEFGTEVNGSWFSWNGVWNGGATKGRFGDPNKPDGPERFVAAYRHIVNVMRAEGADNLRWVFHVNANDSPEVRWNRFENYYPGDAYVDEVAVSAYGTQSPRERKADTFRKMLDRAYPRLVAMAPRKRIVVAEFGTDVRNRHVDAKVWTAAALRDLLGRRWPRIAGFSWWNERWPNDDDPAHDTVMRLQDSPRVARAYRDALSGSGMSFRPPPDRDRLAGVTNWAFAIGRDLDDDTMLRLAKYDLVVVDGEAVSATQVRELKSKGVVVLGYLSVGTIEDWRSWYPRVSAHRLELWDDWNEWYADTSAPAYRAVIADEVAPSMLGKGLDGLFLDNTDMIESHPAQAAGMRQLVAALSERAHSAGALLFTQNGADSIGPTLAYYDGWNLEDVTWTYAFGKNLYVRRTPEDIAANLEALRTMRAAGLLTLATDYVAEDDTAAIAEAKRNARLVGALPFTSDIGLTRLPGP